MRNFLSLIISAALLAVFLGCNFYALCAFSQGHKAVGRIDEEMSIKRGVEKTIKLIARTTKGSASRFARNDVKENSRQAIENIESGAYNPSSAKGLYTNSTLQTDNNSVLILLIISLLLSLEAFSIIKNRII